MQPNSAGDLVGPERECRRKDGTPKIIYSDAAIAEWNLKHGGGKYEAYRCNFGHWHLGNRLRRPTVTYD